MRYTPTLKLSTRLVAVVTMIVTGAIFILFIGGTLSFQRLGHEYLNHYLYGVVEVIDKELEEPDAAYSMQRWVPKLLHASNIVEMTLTSKAGIVYRFKDTTSSVEESRLYHAHFSLKRNQDYTLHFKAVPPYIGFTYSFSAMWSTTFAVILIVVCLLRGVKWLQAQLLGSELLEERGRMILAGQVERYAKGDEREWPYTASEALDRLIEELQDARQERSRFDTFIRTQTFLDQLTGAANRVLFDSKLEAALLENDARGGVLMLQLEELDGRDKSEFDHLVVQVGECISNVIQRYPDAILSRYYDTVFSVLIPHQNSKEVAQVAVQCLKGIERLSPPLPLEPGNWCHIGITMYTEGEQWGRIIDEVETALKTAQLEGVNAWSRFNKVKPVDDERGNVRWRSLFEHNLTEEKICLFKQDCYVISRHNQLSVVHKELFVRIPEPGQGFMKTSRFISAIVTVGYEMVLDRVTCHRVVRFLREEGSGTDIYSINLYVTSFAQRSHFIWFRNLLMQLPREYRQRLCFEFTESHLVKHLDYMRPVLKMIAAFNCQIVAGQVGRTIVSTHYVKEFKIDYLKLHRSLVKGIERRSENQLFVRSMVGVCRGADTQIIAVGVESEGEWKILQSLGVSGVQGRLFDIESQWIPKPRVTNIKPGKRKRWKTKHTQR
ncbi:RNase E specificity factor CsrD [Vibrio sp. MEBiC08052]|uniref:RNase E specificity factor CsrD n=1 Tax=Vibrio sp. MEBiC08052 TaxID=1761910 RepID=UPI0007405945|nr:RNase E specificity factor CsrD [Vibrio sp. MEBiC08052]KUI96610.1 MSHA biogenesis protein MshH [Vibrio sp. MEBiC08052]